jgi:hypothetical protein
MTPKPAPSQLMQNLALANAAVDLRDALHVLIPLAVRERDGLLREMVTGDEISIGQRLVNHALLRRARVWNDAVDVAKLAIRKSEAGE